MPGKLIFNPLTKVLATSVLWFCFSNCAKKNTPLILPKIKISEETIKITKSYFDTLDSYWDILGNSQLPETNSKGEIKFFSIAKGMVLTLKGDQWDSITFQPFNNGKLESYLVYSEIIDDSLIYFFHKRILWKLNINRYTYTKILDLSIGIKNENGSTFYVYHDAFKKSHCIKYSKFQNSLYFPVFTYNKKEDEYFLARYSLNSKSVSIENIIRPDVDEPIQQLMDDNTMYVIDSNLMYIAFGYNKMGLCYDLSTKTIDTINLQSKSDTIPQIAYTEKNTGIKSSGDRFMKTILYNAHYANFIYNPFKRHYYKIFYNHLEENNKSGLKNTLADKRTTLQIFDSKMQLITEVPLSENMNWINAVLPSKEGVLIFNSSNSGNYNLPHKTLILTINYE